jgi:hypothetical protein
MARLGDDPARPFRWGWWFFAIAAGLGTLLRLTTVTGDLPLAYAHVLHAHSHVAMLGWIYNAFFGVALQVFIPAADHRRYAPLFAVTQVAIVGMLVTFPFQGYAAASITFSALHLGCAGVFGWRIMRTVQTNPAARHALGWAFGFMFLSALGPLALGPLAAAGLRGTAWYSFAVYFYLHFQYNGWCVFFLTAVLLRSDAAGGRRAVQLLALGCLATITLSALWMNPPGWVLGLGIAGSAVQLVAVALLARRLTLPLPSASWPVLTLYRLGLAACAAKFALQLLAALPGFTPLAILRSTIVGFLHLVFLGAVTPLLIALALGYGWLRWRTITAAGLGLLLVGTLLTEVVLFSPAAGSLLGLATAWPRTPETLATVAVVMLAGVLATAFGLAPAKSSSPSG